MKKSLSFTRIPYSPLGGLSVVVFWGATAGLVLLVTLAPSELSCWVNLLVAIVITLTIIPLESMPKLFNYPWAIPEQNRAQADYLLANTLREVRAVIVFKLLVDGLLSYFELLQGMNGVSLLATTGVLILVLVAIIVGMFRGLKGLRAGGK